MIPDGDTAATAGASEYTGTAAHYLSPEHVRELAASSITPDVARRNGIYTETDAGEVGRLLGYKGPAKKLGDALVYRFHDRAGNRLPYVQVKPANPPVERKGPDKGKPRKYLCPMYAKSRAYFPLHTRPVLDDPAVPLVITEGPKKAVCADAHGFACVGLVGIWAFAKPQAVDENNEKVGEKELIPDLAGIAWQGREVFIAFDSDRATNNHIRAAEKQLAAPLAKGGARVKVVVLPAAADGSKVGVDDFIVAHGKDRFAELMEAAKPVEEDTDPRPVVFTSVEIHETARRVREVLAGAPGVYSRGNVLMQELQGKLTPIPADYMREMLSANVRFFTKKERRDGTVEDVRVPPPLDAIKPVFARPLPPIRQVDAVAEYPVMLADGRILSRPGYDPGSRILVRMADGLVVDVPDLPTRADGVAAAARLADLFCDFPLVDDTDPKDGKERGCHSRAAAVGFLLTVLARPAIPGPVPFTLVVKNTPGAGGSLLVDTLGVILTGQPFPASSYPNGNHEEMRKLITCWAVEGRPVVNLDNLVGEVGDAELCRAITTTHWEDRILGGSKLYSGPLTTALIGSANNARLAADMPRRVNTIRMETDLPRPEDRTNFKYDLNTYPHAHRGRLLADALTMLRAWVVANRPQADLPAWGKFEAWSLVRHVCKFCGLADPYLPTPSRENNRTRLVRTIATGLRAMDPGQEGMTANAIVKRLTDGTWGEKEEVRDAIDAAAELLDKVTATALGRILANEKNRNLDGIRIVEKGGRDRSNVAKWVAELVVVPDDETNEQTDTDAPRPASESPASPASKGTGEHLFAGDAGDGNGGAGVSAANRTQRSGRMESNPHRETALDDGGAA